MRVAYITSKKGEVALGKEASKLGDSNKARIRIDLGGYRVVPDKSKNNSSTHKQATMTPRQAGFFLPVDSRLYGNAHRAALMRGYSGSVRNMSKLQHRIA
jgi:hypothetical protein